MNTTMVTRINAMVDGPDAVGVPGVGIVDMEFVSTVVSTDVVVAGVVFGTTCSVSTIKPKV